MCVDKIVKYNVKLSEDKVVYKLVVQIDNKLYTPYMLYCLSDKRVHTPKHTNWLFAINGDKYPTGFHCFVTDIFNSKLAKIKKNSALYDMYKDCSVYSFIIPKGTRVYYGEESGYTVIITPMLLNSSYKVSWWRSIFNSIINFIRRIFT